MAKYHNTPNGPRSCRAEKGLCPYGKAGGEHYATQAEAQVAYEEKMNAAFGHMPKFSKVNQIRQSKYQKVDKIKAFATKVKDDAVKARAAVIQAVSKDNRDALKAKALERISAKVASEKALWKENGSALYNATAAHSVEQAKAIWAAATAEAKDKTTQAQNALRKARDEGRQLLADGHAVMTYANYSLKKKFFNFVSRAAKETAARADRVIESKYTRNVPGTEPFKAGGHTFERPRYVVPERVARLAVKAPASNFRPAEYDWNDASSRVMVASSTGETEVFYGGVPAARGAGAQEKEKALA